MRKASEWSCVANGSCGQQAFDFAMPRLETEVLVHHEADAGLPSVAGNLPRLLKRRSKRLLADNMDTHLTGNAAHFEMRVRWRDHIDKIGPFLHEHFPVVRVMSRDAIFLLDRLGSLGIAIA